MTKLFGIAAAIEKRGTSSNLSMSPVSKIDKKNAPTVQVRLEQSGFFKFVTFFNFVQVERPVREVLSEASGMRRSSFGR